MNRMSSWDPENDSEQTFVGLPIALDYKILGVLIIIFPYRKSRNLENDLKFLSLVASALLQPIRIKHVIEEERQKLMSENVILKQKLREGYSFHNIIGNSHEMRDVYEQVSQVESSMAEVADMRHGLYILLQCGHKDLSFPGFDPFGRYAGKVHCRLNADRLDRIVKKGNKEPEPFLEWKCGHVVDSRVSDHGFRVRERLFKGFPALVRVVCAQK